MKTIKLFLGMLFFGLIFTSCTHDDEYINIPPNDQNKSKGGIMFDKFWSTESGFNQNDPNIAIFDASKNFFRCKQCHGWDGLGSSGAYIGRAPKTTRPKVSSLNLYQMAQSESAEELFEGMKETDGRRDISYDLSSYDPITNNVEGDKMPNLNQILTDDQIWDLVKFLKEGMFDVSQLYDAEYSGIYPTGAAIFSNVGLNGNSLNGNIYYTNNCASCHGKDGTTLDLEGKTLGKFVRSKPNEVQHKVHFGQLGSSMIGKFDITLNQMKDLYKAIADEDDFPDDLSYKNAVMSKGGIMFDKFWSTESGFNQNDPNIALFDASKNFFRCKQCHGWDGLGSNGAYISRAPKTSRPNVSSINLYQMGQTESAQEIFDELKETEGRRDISYDLSAYDPDTNNTEGDKMPNLNQILTDDEIWNIVKFIKKGMFDVSQLYAAEYSGSYPTGTASFSNVGLDGNAPNGLAYYTNNCAACHGADGTAINLEGKTLGKFVRSKPNEVQHKVHFGQLGSPMVGKFDITLNQMKDLYRATADIVVFPD